MRLKVWRGLPALSDGATAELRGDFDGDVERLYRSEAPRLARRLARRAGPDVAGDLVQSAFVRLLGMGRERLGRVEQPRAFLGRIADNLANDDAKSARRRFEHVDFGSDDFVVADHDPHAALAARDMLRRIEAAIPKLPERTRAIFEAHRFEDLTYAEIAARMGVSLKTVEKHISIALRELHRAAEPRRDR